MKKKIEHKSESGKEKENNRQQWHKENVKESEMYKYDIKFQN